MANQKGRHCIAIDLKSYFVSVECVERELDPLTTNGVTITLPRLIVNSQLHFTLPPLGMRCNYSV